MTEEEREKVVYNCGDKAFKDSKEWGRIKNPIKNLKNACLTMKNKDMGVTCYSEVKSLETKLERMFREGQ